MAGISVLGVSVPERLTADAVIRKTVSEAAVLIRWVLAIATVMIISGIVLIFMGIGGNGVIKITLADGTTIDVTGGVGFLLVFLAVALVFIARELFGKVADAAAATPPPTAVPAPTP